MEGVFFFFETINSVVEIVLPQKKLFSGLEIISCWKIDLIYVLG